MAAAGGSGIATALAVILIYILKNNGVALPDEISGAVSTIIVAVLTFAAGYLCPPGASEGVVRDANGGVRSAIVPTV